MHQIHPFPDTVDSDVRLVIVTVGRSPQGFCICGVVQQTHELSRNDQHQEVNTSVGCHQGGNDGGNHAAG